MHRSKCEKKNVSSFHVLSARLLVKQEALYYTNAKEWEYETRAPDEDVRTLCQSSDVTTQRKADELFKSILLPELQRQVNENPEYLHLRAIFLWRIVSEWYQRNMKNTFDEALESKQVSCYRSRLHVWLRNNSAKSKSNCISDELTKTLNFLEPEHWYRPVSNTWMPAVVFDEYAKSMIEGEFHITRESRSVEGDVFYRTYFHGGIDFRKLFVRSADVQNLEASKKNSDLTLKWYYIYGGRGLAHADTEDTSLVPGSLGITASFSKSMMNFSYTYPNHEM